MGQWADLSNYSGERFRRVRFLPQKGNNPEESAKDGGSQNAAGATASGRTTRDALAEFTATPLPDAIDGLLFRVSMADPTDPTSSSGFDAYAARLLSEAEAPACAPSPWSIRWSCVA